MSSIKITYISSWYDRAISVSETYKCTIHVNTQISVTTYILTGINVWAEISINLRGF